MTPGCGPGQGQGRIPETPVLGIAKGSPILRHGFTPSGAPLVPPGASAAGIWQTRMDPLDALLILVLFLVLAVGAGAAAGVGVVLSLIRLFGQDPKSQVKVISECWKIREVARPGPSAPRRIARCATGSGREPQSSPP